MAILTEADVVRAAGGEDAYLTLFDRDGDGTADADVVAVALEFAEARVAGALAASHPGVVFDTPGPVPALVRIAAALLAVGFAENFSLTLRNQKPEPGKGYMAMGEMALAAFKNGETRLPTGQPQPRTILRNGTDADGWPTNPLTRVADGRDPSAY